MRKNNSSILTFEYYYGGFGNMLYSMLSVMTAAFVTGNEFHLKSVL